MAKNQSRDPLVLSPNWHVDCQLSSELPDDRVVSSRFLLNLPFAAVTLALLVIFFWELSTDFSLNAAISDRARKINDSRVQIATIKQQQRDYTGYAFKIEAAHNLVKNRLYVSHFMSELSVARPGPMVIEAVEMIESSIIVRGTLTGSAEDSTSLVSAYLKRLHADPEIEKRFQTVLLTSFERARSMDVQNFELTFRFKPEAAP